MTRQLWRDGTLRETCLVVNGLPDAGEVELPDETFIGPEGAQVQIVRAVRSYEPNEWVVSAPPDYENGESFSTYGQAFAVALSKVREVVE